MRSTAGGTRLPPFYVCAYVCVPSQSLILGSPLAVRAASHPGVHVGACRQRSPFLAPSEPLSSRGDGGCPALVHTEHLLCPARPKIAPFPRVHGDFRAPWEVFEEVVSVGACPELCCLNAGCICIGRGVNERGVGSAP